MGASVDCEECDGTGYVVCPSCDGSGLVEDDSEKVERIMKVIDERGGENA